MYTIIIIFLVVATVFGIASLIYVTADLIIEKKNKKKNQEPQKEEQKEKEETAA